MSLENKFYIGVDQKKRKIVDIGFNGYLAIHSKPFKLHYEFDYYDSILKENSISGAGAKSYKSLSQIDGLKYNDPFGDFKIEIKKGIVYLQGKPLSEY